MPAAAASWFLPKGAQTSSATRTVQQVTTRSSVPPICPRWASRCIPPGMGTPAQALSQPQAGKAEDVARLVRDRGVEFLFAQFVDLHGKPNAKLVPAHHLDDLLEDGAGFAGFAAGDIGQGPHDPDLVAIPDVRSFTILPGSAMWRVSRAT